MFCEEYTGSHTGYQRHKRHKEEPCSACAQGQADYNKLWRLNNLDKHKQIAARSYNKSKDEINVKAREKRAADPSVYAKEHARRLLNVNKIKEQRKAWRLAHPHKNAEYLQRRKAKGRFVEYVDRYVLAIRDNWICYLCEREINKNPWSASDPWCLEIDHVIPLSKNGENSYANCKSSHRRCNGSKNSGEFNKSRADSWFIAEEAVA